ncbi:hypothetical protein [Burkholderia pseudomallei]|uniref:hypothetical protein n=1 Tax=Burkholderia pseudomallei TaxID=28450 RepID=UPI0021805FB4|nr:hypothetical protein [Burkholderia pseudomallei]
MCTNGTDRAASIAGAALCIVRAEQDEIGAARLGLPRRPLPQPPRFVPAARVPPRLDLVEADGGHDAARIAMPAEARRPPRVDRPIVCGRRFPAHPADQFDRFHRVPPASGVFATTKTNLATRQPR